MKKKILIVTATEIEAYALSELYVDNQSISLDFLATGVGTMACARSLTRYFMTNSPPALAINAGIAGSFRTELPIGSSVIINRDCFADFGVDDNGHFLAAADAGLVSADGNPFEKGGWILCNNSYTEKLAESVQFSTGITSDTVSGSSKRISLLRNIFNPDIESMEGASFFYICSLEQVPCIAVRAISNMVEERNRDNWDIPMALMRMRERTEGVLTLLFKSA